MTELILCNQCGEDTRVELDLCTSCGQMFDREPEGSAEEYGLIVSFPDQSETFVLGFEAGMIWRQLQAGEDGIDVNVHTLNVEVLARMCAASNVRPVFRPTNTQGWTNLTIKRGPRKPDLRLVRSTP